MKSRPRITQDPVAPALLRLALPMTLGAMGIVAFNLVDTYFVGRLGAIQLAAMGFSFPVVLVTGSLAMGVGIGTSSNVARMLGAGHRAEATRITSDAHLLALALGVALALAGLLTIEPLFRALGATDETLPYIRRYMTVWYMGIPFVVLPMIGQSVLQATGDSRTPSLVLGSAVAANIILDPILIFGLGPIPAMGIAGAALATVIARGSSLIIVGLVVVRRERLVSFQGISLPAVLRSWGGVLFIGVPAAATNIILPLSMGVITRLVSGFGELAVAGFGMATRVESFALIFTLALSMILTPFVGQNVGAGRPDRARLAFQWASLFSLVWGVLAFAVFLAASRPIASVFTDNPTITRVGSRYLQIVALSYGLQGVVNLASAAFNGMRRPYAAAGVAFVRMFVLYVPLALVGRAVFGLEGIFVGAGLANIVSGVFSYLVLLRTTPTGDFVAEGDGMV